MELKLSKGDLKGLLRPLVAEFFGLVVFAFIGTLLGGKDLTAVALGHGLTIFVLIAGLGHISGGHFNPAVTSGVVLAGGLPPIHGIFYVLSQLSGSFLGSLLARAALGASRFAAVTGGTTTPQADVEQLEALTAEIMLTMLLVSTVLMTAVDNDSNVLAPLAIGLSIAADIMAGGNISGASMNPARSFGPALGYAAFGGNGEHWKSHWIYWLGPLVGSAIAALLFRLFFGNENKRWILK